MQRTPKRGLAQPRGSWIVGMLLAGTAMGAFGGCDSTTEIAFPEVYLNKVQMYGTVNATSCSVSDEVATLRFALTSTESEVPLIMPGTIVGNQPVELGTSFSGGDIQLLDSILYPSPDVTCTGDGDCSALGAGFVCQPLNPSHSASANVCGRPINLNVQTDTLEYHIAPSVQDFVLSMYNGATILGVNPEEGGTPPVGAQWRSDPSNIAVASALTFPGRVVDYMDDDSRVCAASWNGLATLNMIPSRANCLTEVGGSGEDDIRDNLNSIQATSQRPRALWDEANSVASFLGETTTAERSHIVVFTDGTNTAESANYDTMIANAQAAGASLHFVHLDNLAFDAANTDLYPGPQGGLDEMAQAACVTGGSYRLASNPFDLFEIYRSMAAGMAGHYSLNVTIPALQSPDLAAGSYRVATTMNITLHDTSDTFEFRGAMRVGELGDLTDQRLVIFKR